jgi:hypothetical protein
MEGSGKMEREVWMDVISPPSRENVKELNTGLRVIFGKIDSCLSSNISFFLLLLSSFFKK